MGSLNTGGGSSAVAASAHAGCRRFRHTDPLVVGRTRRKLAEHIGFSDTSAGIPESRWMRAMTFEALVRHERFVSQLLTTVVGRLGLERPIAVRRADGKVSLAATSAALEQAHVKAVQANQATMITGLAVPFVGLEGEEATPVKPDFAVVAPRPAGDGDDGGSWLIMGDAKDYERVRSRIDDQRMLKGFLQVALGAESAAEWSQLPAGMNVHRFGALAVPRNAFLQPEAVVEQLDDHRREVRNRVDERTQLLRELGTTPVPDDQLAEFVAQLEATFDPSSCASCALFNFCRHEVRSSADPAALLVEIGVKPELRSCLSGLIDGSENVGSVAASLVANVRATLTGRPMWTGQRRVDPADLPGTLNIVLAKSDSAAMGVYGVGFRRVRADGRSTDWSFHTFGDPQSPDTRLQIMGLIGEAIDATLIELTRVNSIESDPIHLILPDTVTGDVLVSMADSLAGVETSRLRWQRDLEMGRPPLTFNGEPAVVPDPLGPAQRLAVSFLLEEDRARAMSLRWPLVDLRTALARHLVPGGPAVDHGRLDYLVQWAEATSPLRHREVSDAISSSDHTPGARLANRRSDAIHQALPQAGRTGGNRAVCEALVLDELAYKADIVDRAIAVLGRVPDSALRPLYRTLEATAQEVWRRRLRLRASDLVRFGRTSWVWRNSQVPMIDADKKCVDQLLALGNPQSARDMALDAGNREVALATVTGVNPLRLAVRSRRLVAGSSIVALQVNGEPCVDQPTVDVKIQKGSFKFSNLIGGELIAADATADGTGLQWVPSLPTTVAVGDELIVANRDWFGGLKARDQIRVDRPSADTNSAPRDGCSKDAYDGDPSAHQWCCRPHESAEAEFADILAGRRARGELNPQAWPPVVDDDRFDTVAAESPTDATELGIDATASPDGLTMDDVD
jgi:hypothetical protein